MSARAAFRTAFQTELLHTLCCVLQAGREPDEDARRKMVGEAAEYIGRAADVAYDEMVRIAQNGGLV